MKLLGLILLLVSSALAQVTVVPAVGGTAGSAGGGGLTAVGSAGICSNALNTLAVTYSASAGNTLFAGVFTYNSVGSATGVATNTSQAFTKDSEAHIGGNWMQIWSYTNIGAGITSITATRSTTDYMCISVLEVSGGGSMVTDVVDNTGSSGSSATWSRAVTTSAPKIVVGWGAQIGSNVTMLGAATGFTTWGASALFNTTNSCAGSQKITSTPATDTAGGALSGSASWLSIAGSYK